MTGVPRRRAVPAVIRRDLGTKRCACSARAQLHEV
jgi:hypothetical protein